MNLHDIHAELARLERREKRRQIAVGIYMSGIVIAVYAALVAYIIAAPSCGVVP